MDEELLSKGFASLEVLDQRIAQLRRLLAEESAQGRSATPEIADDTLQPGQKMRISQTSLTGIYESELSELLALRERVAQSDTEALPPLALPSKFDVTAWLGWLILAAAAAAIYYFLFR